MATGNEPDVRDLRRQALEALRRLEKKPKKAVPQASPELWPGEHMDLGGFTLAQLKQHLKERIG